MTVIAKLVHAFGLQMPITAECSMRRCWATAVAMATPFWRTCRVHDGMRPAKFRPNRSIAKRYGMPIFSNMAAVRHFEFKKI